MQSIVLDQSSIHMPLGCNARATAWHHIMAQTSPWYKPEDKIFYHSFFMAYHVR